MGGNYGHCHQCFFDHGKFMLSKSDTVHLTKLHTGKSSSLAYFLNDLGWDVRGFAEAENQTTRDLEKRGVSLQIAPSRIDLDGIDAFIVPSRSEFSMSSAAGNESADIPVFEHSHVLDKVSRDYHTIGVLGTHGSATVASLIVWILEQAGLDPSFAVSGTPANLEVNGRATDGDWLVLELDENDSATLQVDPEYLVCNFLETEHLDYYNDYGAVVDRIRGFLETSPGLREFFVNLDCRGNRQLVEKLKLRPTGYSTNHRAEYHGRLLVENDDHLEFTVARRSNDLGTCKLGTVGSYNVVNALGALAVGAQIGVAFDTIKESFETFRGLEGRFATDYAGGIKVVKDAEIHPPHVQKTLSSATNGRSGKLFAVFDPNSDIAREYSPAPYRQAFDAADAVVLISSEDSNDISPAEWQKALQESDIECEIVESREQATGALLDHCAPQDTIVFFGAGLPKRIAEELTAQLAKRSEATEPEPEQPKVAGPFIDETQT